MRPRGPLPKIDYIPEKVENYQCKFPFSSRRHMCVVGRWAPGGAVIRTALWPPRAYAERHTVTVLAHMVVLLSLGQGVISSVLSDDNALLLEAKLVCAFQPEQVMYCTSKPGHGACAVDMRCNYKCIAPNPGSTPGTDCSSDRAPPAGQKNNGCLHPMSAWRCACP